MFISNYIIFRIRYWPIKRYLQQTLIYFDISHGFTFRGYTAPEYAIHGQLSEKADTYSYGVVVLEIISGQKSTEIRADLAGGYLLERVFFFFLYLKCFPLNFHISIINIILLINILHVIV